MHIVFRESRGLEETDVPMDPGQTPGDLVVLSYSDSDLGAFAAGWKRAAGTLPSTRLCNIVGLRHPVSVDTYVEATLSGAKAILIRLIGGVDYWPYGVACIQDLARRNGIALAIVPADGRPDPRLDAVSNVASDVLAQLKGFCDAGTPIAAQQALSVLARAAHLPVGPVAPEVPVPKWGFYDPDHGGIDQPPYGAPIYVTFYRSYLSADDLAPVDALIQGLRAAGHQACGVFAPSLKTPGFAQWIAPYIQADQPCAIVNATAFSAQGQEGRTPFDGAQCPVFQVALSTARKREWAEAERGLSPADLAMHVVLPEVDGRVFSGIVSFKQPGVKDADLQYSRFVHRAVPEQIAAVVAKVTAWVALSQTPAHDKRVAIVLSTYPGRAWQMAHAVGLDALASTESALGWLCAAGYDTQALGLADLGDHQIAWPLEQYRAALQALPQELQDDLVTAWGAPEADPAIEDGMVYFTARKIGKTYVALQPERGDVNARDDEYHDLQRTPRHGYVAFYLWLRAQNIDALIHMGAHGTLEWLPGKSVALSQSCWPEALIGATPVVYPFIVNDPGEAAQAKRRIGAVTLGHMPPPMTGAATPPQMAHLERLLDEYSTADGLDPNRRLRLVADIQSETNALGLHEDLGLSPQASPAEVITRIDRFVCDIKESQFGEGLHVLGSGPCGTAEQAGLMAAVVGRKVAPGPSGSPSRGRADVMPTGRNLFSVDPRAVPSKAAQAQGVKLAEELLRRHLQDHGDWPQGLVVDLWGSATMRTSGEEFAMALHLAGLKPVWDDGSGRVSGVEVIVPALLGRPRIDVTLRVSGLFRDVFPSLAQLFEAGADMLAVRDEPEAENPYATRQPRVFGPKPGQYGLGMGDLTAQFTEDARIAAGEAWLAASSYAIGKDGQIAQDRAGLEARLQKSSALIHAQDLPETDLLLASDYAGHEAGFAAAMDRIGASAPEIYHLDSTRVGDPRARSLTEEIARVVRARAANPIWVDSMTEHGFRGGAEIAATLDNMAAFAQLAQVVPGHLFDLYHEATLGRPDIVAFLQQHNPQALRAMRDLFARLHEAGLWVTRRNSILADLETRS
ncbi:cobaltochelatase subunit CobN [Thioclava sp. SK-1]|uniref:cobaltochelatase subunit CobN n=1 Tax=Thioclava sp. SK-1 TaxID=1889770 RepID=UPI00082635CC|nr:cobaltochelatase subunit CobN [Thioclava sp. SK-1]OCX65985.1 cobaltochelatase subunit CobN [Thioclava sp. SK-1]